MSDKNAPKTSGPTPPETKTPDQLLEHCLKSYSQAIRCKCDQLVITESVQKCNPVSMITCYCCGCCWGIHHLLKHKDINCYDATHTCPKKCGYTFEYKNC